MPPPSAHNNPTSTARVLCPPRVYTRTSTSIPSQSTYSSASEDDRPARRPLRKPSTSHLPTASSSQKLSSIMASTTARRLSYGLPANPRSPNAHHPAPKAVTSQIPGPRGQTLRHRRSFIGPAVPAIDTQIQKPSQSQQPDKPRIYPELDRWPSTTHTRNHSNSPNPLELPTPSLLSTESPNTLLSESPGPFPWSVPGSALSPYSRDTTPTSILSQSPGLYQGTRSIPRTLVSPGNGTSLGQSTASTVKNPAPSSPPKKSSYKHLRPKDITNVHSAPTKRLWRPSVTFPSPQPAKVNPPRRPSRDGISDLPLAEPPRVIKSKLAPYHIRRPSDSSITNNGPGPTIISSPDRERPRRILAAPTREATPAPLPTRLRTPSLIVSSTSRFPFFNKKKDTQVSKEKRTRKGPAAGTGHEGYGRLGAARRRSGSLSGVRGMTSSQESLPVDTFFLDRMSPVVISGGEIIKNHNAGISRSSSETSLAVEFTAPSLAAASLRPSAITQKGWRSSDNSDSEAMAAQNTLAFRKQRQRIYAGRSTTEKAAAASNKTVGSSETSLEEGIFSDESLIDSSVATIVTLPSILGKPEDTTTGSTSKLGPKKLTKRARSPRRWNLFSSKAHVAEKAKASLPQPPLDLVAQITAVPTPPKPQFYYMMDSSDAEIDIDADTKVEEVVEGLVMPNRDEVRDVLRGAEVNLPTIEMERVGLQIKIEEDMVKPMMPRSEAVSTDSSPVVAQEAKMGGLQPRLRQVGRIPKVVSSRILQTDQTAKFPEITAPQTTQSPVSFSRPFNRTSFHTAMHLMSGSATPTPTAPATSTPDLNTGTTISSDSPPVLAHPGRTSMIISSPTEFLRFPASRKDSTSTSTTSTYSANMFRYGYTETVAVLPAPDAPLAEDEIWAEYDDLLSVMAMVPPAPPLNFEIPDSTSAPASASEDFNPLSSSSKSPPFSLETYSRLTVTNPNLDRLMTTSSIGADMTERLRAIFSQKPEDPPQKPIPTKPIPNTPSPPEDPAIRIVTASARSSTSSSGVSASPLRQVNLRVGSMTVSKWLSFGHVLFSPIRESLSMKSLSYAEAPTKAVLVLDGLGNDDWSFYAAETYPGATFYNLSPRAPIPMEKKQSAAFPASPKNHHQIQHRSLAAAFPFAPSSFTAVIFRFPEACPKNHLANVISETRRVLVPGGYLELSLLDIDLNNMGARTRRAVRRLKEALREQNPDTMLSFTADTILKHMVPLNFTDIKSCRVGLPVASPPGQGRRRDTRSLAEMMSDEGPGADASITKMVSRVGRWWYSRCFESQIGKSVPGIWSDKNVLAECVEWGTSLKLMVCYARVPE